MSNTNFYLNKEFMSAVAMFGGKPLDELDRNDLMAVSYQFYINAQCSDEARVETFKENDSLDWENTKLRKEIHTYQESLRWSRSPAQSPPRSPLVTETTPFCGSKCYRTHSGNHQSSFVAQNSTAQAVENATIKALLSLDRVQGVE